MSSLLKINMVFILDKGSGLELAPMFSSSDPKCERHVLPREDPTFVDCDIGHEVPCMFISYMDIGVVVFN